MVTLDSSITPWLNLLLYRSVVNQAVRPYETDIAYAGSLGEVRIPCSDQGEPTNVPYEAYVEAMIPGLPELVKTETVLFDMKCYARPAPTAGSPSHSLTAAAGSAAAPVSTPSTGSAANGCGLMSSPASRSFPASLLVACALCLGYVRARRNRNKSARR